MLIEQALMTFLKAQSDVTDLVSTRIYFVRAPQDVSEPYIVVSKVSGPREHSHEGGDGMASPRFQLSSFSTSYATVKGIAAALQTVLQGYSGTMGGESGVKVGNILYSNEVDLYEEDTRLHHVAADYIIWHRED